MTNDGVELIGARDAAALIGISPRQLLRVAHSGKLPIRFQRVPGSALIFDADDVRAYADHRRPEGTTDDPEH